MRGWLVRVKASAPFSRTFLPQPSGCHQSVRLWQGCSFRCCHMGIRNQAQMTEPYFQIAEMEGSNGLKSVFAPEPKARFQVSTRSRLREAQHAELTAQKPALKTGDSARGAPRPHRQSRGWPWPGCQLHTRPSVGTNLS